MDEFWSQDVDEDIQSKLMKLGSFLTEWSRGRIGCIKHKIAVLKTKLLRIQSWRPSTANIQREKLVTAQLNGYLIMEVTYWDHRMKQQWVKYGDRKHTFTCLYNKEETKILSAIYYLIIILG